MRRQNCCCFPDLSLWGQEWFGFSELSPCFKVLPAAPGKHQYREMLCRHFLPSAPVGCYLSGRCHWAVPQQNLHLSFGCKARSLNKGTLLFEGTSSCFSHCFSSYNGIRRTRVMLVKCFKVPGTVPLPHIASGHWDYYYFIFFSASTVSWGYRLQTSQPMNNIHVNTCHPVTCSKPGILLPVSTMCWHWQGERACLIQSCWTQLQQI